MRGEILNALRISATTLSLQCILIHNDPTRPKRMARSRMSRRLAIRQDRSAAIVLSGKSGEVGCLESFKVEGTTETPRPR
jgi:hypothetical protein